MYTMTLLVTLSMILITLLTHSLLYSIFAWQHSIYHRPELNDSAISLSFHKTKRQLLVTFSDFSKYTDKTRKNWKKARSLCKFTYTKLYLFCCCCCCFSCMNKINVNLIKLQYDATMIFLPTKKINYCAGILHNAIETYIPTYYTWKEWK